ncbi:MAG: riboflavin synthase [Candidatus Omnitrophica bacterium]|nr:riboflavin synthase [Candidatus Omnitrophota bacterium]
MFSGIIEELGRVKNVSRRGNVTLLQIEADKACLDTGVGESISVNGACLTVVRNENKILSFEAIPETLKTTNLGFLRNQDKVNLERSLKAGDRISGHFVTGHVDCLGVIRNKHYKGANLSFEIAVPGQCMRYVLPKGSISVDGISLTVADKRGATLCVYVIPHTLKNTTLGFKGPSDKVNIEFDILAKKTSAAA